MPVVILSNGPASTFVTLQASAAQTASGNSGPLGGGFERYSTADFFLNCSARSGTSPTLNVRIQTLAPDGAVGAQTGTWVDILAFNQVTNTGKQWAHFIAGANSIFTPTTGTLTVGSFANVNLGGYLRVAWVLGGSTPSFTFAITGHFFN